MPSMEVVEFFQHEVQFPYGVINRVSAPVDTLSLPPRVVRTPPRSKPQHLQFTPVSRLGNTLPLESKTKQPIHAGQN